MAETVINELNVLLKGEHMAIGAYERYIKETQEENIKKEFQQIQQDHKSHASELHGRIQALGGQPESNTGFAGFMASAKAAMGDLGEKDASALLKKAYDGEDKGIAMAEEIVKGDLDAESAAIVNRILSVDHGHLSKMMHMLSDMGEYR